MRTPASLRSDPPAGFTGLSGRFPPERMAGLTGMATDISAQIINMVILRGKRREDHVYIKAILKTMQKEVIAGDVVAQVNKLLSDDALRYIEAFCNTIKHRRLIRTNFRAAEHGETTRNENGLIFEELTFKGNVYPDKPVSKWGRSLII